MGYSLSQTLKPFGHAVKYYLIQLRPRSNDTVSIVAVVVCSPIIQGPPSFALKTAVVADMIRQMEQDLRQRAVDMNINHCFWDYQCEVWCDNS